MNGPVYPVGRGHKFPPEPTARKEGTGSGELKFPVYNVDVHHKFQDKAPAHHKLNPLQGPSYQVERDHHFTKENTIHEKLKTLVGPAYDVGGDSHKYPAEGKVEVPGVKPQKEIFSPVMDVDHSSNYKPIDEPHHDVSELHGPKFAISRDHQFTGLELETEFAPTKQAPKEMVGPVYEAVDNSHNYSPVPPKQIAGRDYYSANQ